MPAVLTCLLLPAALRALPRSLSSLSSKMSSEVAIRVGKAGSSGSALNDGTCDYCRVGGWVGLRQGGWLGGAEAGWVAGWG